MSFLCKECNKTSEPRTRMNKVVVETRQRSYYNIIARHKLVKKPRFMQFERKDQTILDDLKKQGWKVLRETETKGSEIVREKNVCDRCIKNV